MERTEYFNQTKPSQTQLNNTEDSKVRQILYRNRSFDQFGVRTGFRVTINSGDATKIDIGPGEGYTGGFFEAENLNGSPNSGERISTLTDNLSGQTAYEKTAEAQALADYTSGTKNYVTLLYVETTSHPLAERTYPFTQHNTIVSNTYQVSVVTETQWNALTSNEKEQRILVAIVTAQGAGTALSTANIDQVVQPKDHPIPGSQPSNITGVTITNISEETLIGNGTLRYDNSSKKVYWTAPGDTEGTGVGIPSSGAYTLYSDFVSYYVEIYVTFASLPGSNQTDTISIESLYGREIPIACAKDQAHRDMIGSGIKTVSNPHGLSIDDISGAGYDHADLFHKNGISSDADSGQLLAVINAVNDSIEIENIGAQRNSFLIDGQTYQLITGYSAGNPGIVNFDVTPALDSGDYLIYIDSAGEPQRVKIAEYTPANPGDTTVLWDSNIKIYDMKNETAGNGTITWDAIAQSLTYKAPGDGAAGDPVYICEIWGVGVSPNGYYKLYSNNTDNWVIVGIDGALGVSDSSTFAIDKNETDHPDESILKIAIVTWNATGEILANLRDIREWYTADTKEETFEEHDEDGQHTKVLRNQFRVARESCCIYAYAESGSAIRGYGGDGESAIIGECSESYGVVGICSTKIGVYGSAPNTGGSFYAATDTGIKCVADGNVGVYGSASGGTAGYFLAKAGIGPYTDVALEAIAQDTVISARAHNNLPGDGTIAYFGTADGKLAYVGSAPNSVASFSADSKSAVIGIAESTAGYFEADSIVGVYGKAPATAISGSALNCGIHGLANVDTGVFGSASNNAGVRGYADNNYGVYGYAENDYGVYGKAESSVGVYGYASENFGVYGYVPAVDATAIFGKAGHVNGGIGVFGSAENVANCTGVYGECGLSATGVHGHAGQTAVGVYGDAGTSGIGVIGYAITSGTGVIGTGDGNQVYGVWGDGTIGVKGTGNTGVYGVGGLGGEFYGTPALSVEGSIIYDIASVAVASISHGPVTSQAVAFLPIIADIGAGLDTNLAIAIYTVTEIP